MLSPLERREFDFSDLNRWMREADQTIRRTKAVLDRLAAQPLCPQPTALDHLPRGRSALSEDVRLRVRRGGRVLVVNPGSAGEARDSSTRRQLSCAVLDTVTGEAVVIDYPDSY